MRKRWLLAALGLMVLCAEPALAQGADDASRAAARDMGYSGVEAYQKGDYAMALDKLGRAYRILRVPTLGLWLARALEKSGKLVEAAERYSEVTRMEASGSDAAVHRKAQGEAEAERVALMPRIPSLVLKVADGNDAELEVKIDGVAISSAFLGEKRLINPGKHEIAATRGSERFSTTLTLQEGESRTLLVEFHPPSGSSSPNHGASDGRAGQPAASEGATTGAPEQEKSSTGKTLAWTSLAIGGVGIVVGGVTGFMAMSKRSSLDCPDDSCTSDKQDEVDSYNTLRSVSTVSFVAGAVFATTGGVLLLTNRGSDGARRPGASPFIGLGRVGVRGQF